MLAALGASLAPLLAHSLPWQVVAVRSAAPLAEAEQPPAAPELPGEERLDLDGGEPRAELSDGCFVQDRWAPFAASSELAQRAAIGEARRAHAPRVPRPSWLG